MHVGFPSCDCIVNESFIKPGGRLLSIAIEQKKHSPNTKRHLTQCVRGPRTKKSVLVVGVAVVIRRLLRRLSLLRRLVGIVFLVSIVDMLISVVSIN